MARATLVLVSPEIRERAARWVAELPDGTRVDFKGPSRSLQQNDKMWAMLTEVATQVTWYGDKLSADDWKMIFINALKRELRMVPNLDGRGVVVVGQSSSDLSKSEMADLITLIEQFGANHGVVFHD